jgi:hypothetical protein
MEILGDMMGIVRWCSLQDTGWYKNKVRRKRDTPLAIESWKR